MPRSPPSSRGSDGKGKDFIDCVSDEFWNRRRGYSTSFETTEYIQYRWWQLLSFSQFFSKRCQPSWIQSCESCRCVWQVFKCRRPLRMDTRRSSGMWDVVEVLEALSRVTKTLRVNLWTCDVCMQIHISCVCMFSFMSQIKWTPDSVRGITCMALEQVDNICCVYDLQDLTRFVVFMWGGRNQRNWCAVFLCTILRRETNGDRSECILRRTIKTQSHIFGAPLYWRLLNYQSFWAIKLLIAYSIERLVTHLLIKAQSHICGAQWKVVEL